MTALGTKAQSNMAFYPLDEQFNSSDFNPAFLYSREKYTFSIFPIGGTSIAYNNQEIIKDLVLESLHGITSDDDYKKVLQSITDRSSFNQNIESTLLTFTARTKIGFFNFRITENQNFTAAVKGELTSFVFNKDIQSATINRIQNLPAQGMHFREYSIGYSLPSKNHKFTAGIRPKIYFGKAAFFSGLSGSIVKDSANYILRAGGKVKLSIPMTKTPASGDSVGTLDLSGRNLINYLTNSSNPGFGIDLGIKYKITPDLTLSASVLDLGKIEWKSNLNSKIFDGEYSISETKVTSNNLGGNAEIITKNFNNASFSDSISNIFKQGIDTTEFSSTMPVNVFAGIKYQVNPKVNISLIDRYFYLKNLKSNSFSILADIEINKKLSVCTGYSVISNSHTNLPLAFLYQKDFGQIYLGTDNILSFLLPTVSDFAGLTFGTCFYLFRNRNLSNSITEDYPFYRPKNTKRNPKTGLIWKENTDF
jgi:hypothetical protein